MQDIENKLEKYHNLSTDQKIIADLAIMIIEPFAIYNFHQLYLSQIKTIRSSSIPYLIRDLLVKDILSEYRSYMYQINPILVVGILPELLKDKNNDKFLAIINNHSDQYRYDYLGRDGYLYKLRNILQIYFKGEESRIPELLTGLSHIALFLSDYFVLMINFPVYDNLLIRLGPEQFRYVVKESFRIRTMHIIDLKPIEELIFKYLSTKEKSSLYFSENSTLASIQLFKGNLKFALEKINIAESNDACWIRSIALIYGGNPHQGQEYFFNKITEFRKLEGQKFVPGKIYMYFMAISFITQPSEKSTAMLTKLIKTFKKENQIEERQLLILFYLANNQLYEAKTELKISERSNTDNWTELSKFGLLLSAFLINQKFISWQQELAHQLLKEAIANNFLLIALEIACMNYRLSESLEDKMILEDLTKKLNLNPLLGQIEKASSWENSLNTLLSIGSSKAKAPSKSEISRIIYLINFEIKQFQPVIQTTTSKGWSKGRNIALKRFKNNDVEGMTEQDRKIAGNIRINSSYYGADYYYDFEKLAIDLVGHPLLFLYENPDLSMELIRSSPELMTEKTKNGFMIRSNLKNISEEVIIQKETNTRYKLIQLSPEQISVIQTLNDSKVIIPETGKDLLVKTISHLSSFMTVHSDLSIEDSQLKNVEADSRIRVQMMPIGNSLKADWFVKPLGTDPPYCKPGKGGITVYGSVNGEKCNTKRNLQKELGHLSELSALLEQISGMDLLQEAIHLDSPEDCLQLLEIIKQNPQTAVIEWPEGERFRLKRSVSFKQLSLSVKGKDYWFELQGDLKVDENMVLSLKQLLAMTQRSKGRFIELENGEYLALSQELKKRLEELSLFSVIDKSGVKINKFAVPALEELTKDVGSFKTDVVWKNFQQKLNDKREILYPIPETLQAELRPYQEEGFRWMTRLSDWDAGACLADDMGLGKTVQALALLLHRAEQGPALVVCPASVVANWASETEKFAPTLTIHTFRNYNREDVLEKQGPFDVMVMTYGLLQSEEERLSKITWSTVVLDEAHAIKNTNTKTSKAAMSIKANFRLILTGTPIQNHLGELWNLFTFINPGLLGNLQQFNERFVNPSMINGNGPEKLYLKKLIAPFILRRTKSLVLEELPAKTEITKIVELSEKEMAFYESLRREALEHINTSSDPSGTQHLKVLAEITRLRLACCNPQLVDDRIKIPSAKQQAFLEIVEELIENKHRALVFSQFIGHLAILRKLLEEKGISYQYLDGSTPVEKRESIVKDFQSGKGELFLISLKAGGLGLNLTAADYVIHMDPWWNPAVEDQASDRAHRIGQQRPVTVYRIVAKNTIEEKIIQLHHTKRDMADSLLEGSDQAAKLSTDDLMNLLRDI